MSLKSMIIGESEIRQVLQQHDHVGATDQQGTVIISGSYRGYTFPIELYKRGELKL